MKRKLVAVAMLLIFIANLAGYRLAYWWASHVAVEELEVKLDSEDYDPNDLVLFHIPVNMPYQAGENEFERVYGELIVDGTVFTYVERKVSGGEVWLKCIRNKEAVRLCEIRDDLFKASAGLPPTGGTEKKQEKTAGFKQSIADFEMQPLACVNGHCQLPKLIYHIGYHQYCPLVFLTISDKPPEMHFA